MNSAAPESTEIETTERGSLGKVSDALAAKHSGVLKVTQGESVGKVFEIRDTPLIMGRSGDCEVRLLNRSVSRLHCRVWQDASGFWLRDLNSTNRTFLNDRPVIESRLKANDLIMVGGTVFQFVEQSDKTIKAEPVVYALSAQDGVTGMISRGHFEMELDREIARCRRHQRGFVVARIDIDQLREVNRQYGQRAGDEALRVLGKMISGGIRTEDCAARLGEDDLAVLLTETQVEHAAPILQSIRSAIANTTLTSEGRSFKVTVSIGAITWTPAVAGRADLMSAMDQALAKAKAAGGNKLVAG